jgi:hypothetical protein
MKPPIKENTARSASWFSDGANGQMGKFTIRSRTPKLKLNSGYLWSPQGEDLLIGTAEIDPKRSSALLEYLP